MSAASSVQSAPKRGGFDTTFGAYMGGGPMDADYKIVSSEFNCVSQLRSIKQLQIIQSTFDQARDNTAVPKFHGNVELEDSKLATELDKKNFVKKLDRLVEAHGFQGFFYLKGTDGKIYSLLTHFHLFTLNDVIKEHRDRSAPHVAVLDSAGIETEASLKLSFSKYDKYDKLDCRLSRLAVESLVGASLQEDIETRYSHLDDFSTLPGNVYFLMVLEASNASVALDIDDAAEKFSSLALASFPGENIKGLATEALRLIRIMEGGYCLPGKLGSDLLRKVYGTSCEQFNRWVHSKLDEVRELELKYKLKDPKLMVSDPLYSTLGPIALCGFLQERYGSLITEKAWPALSSSFPKSNLAPVPSATRACFKCGATDHLRDTCPVLGRDGGGRGGRRGKKSDGTSPPVQPGNSTIPAPTSGGSTPFPAWRYIEPADTTSAIVMDGVTYKWCSSCRCRSTGKQGYYTTTHFTAEHVDRSVRFASGTAVNHSPTVLPIVPLADASFVPDTVPDEEVLVFSGPWHCPIIDTTCYEDVDYPSVWMAPVLSSELVEERGDVLYATTPHDESGDALSIALVDQGDALSIALVDHYTHPWYSSEVSGHRVTPSIPPSAHLSNIVLSDLINNASCAATSSLFLCSDSSSKLTHVNTYDDVFYDANDLDDSNLLVSVPDSSGLPLSTPPPPVRLSWFHLFVSCFLFCMTLARSWMSKQVSWMIDGVCWCVELGITITSQWLFFGGTLFWDTFELFVHSSPGTSSIPRRYRRAKVVPAKLFPRHWMLLSSLMLVSGFKEFLPFDIVLIPVLLTYRRCQRIGNLTYMSPLIVWDLHRLRFNSIFRDAFGATLEEAKPIPEGVSHHHNQPFDALDVDETNPHEHYVDAHEVLPSLDLFQLDGLCTAPLVVDCTHLTSSDDLSDPIPSKPGLNAAIQGIHYMDCLAPSHLNRFPVIFDSGASVAISGDRNDFVGALQIPFRDLRLGGMAQGAKVEGIGVVHWTFYTGKSALTLALQCYYVPDCQARLLSPQRLFKAERGITGEFSVREENAVLTISNHPELVIEYERTSNLPVGLAYNAKSQNQDRIYPQANLCVTDASNQNLTPSQKLLLMWHYRFGHRNMAHVQQLLRLPTFAGAKYQSASRADVPRCAICEYAKGHVRSTSGNKRVVNDVSDGALKVNCLHPGAQVSADHFESRLKGRTYSSFGKTTSDQFVGGCIFVDHMSGYVHVEHQLGFSSSETIRAKQSFEQLALSHGVLIENYLADNGIFNKTSFVEHIRAHNQQIHYCGVNAHHKNAIAERAIRTISELARSLILHASIHWRDGIDGALWPMAIDYATHIYNTLPNNHGICPADLFTGTTIPRHKLRDLHVWGCPVYVLDPALQQGKKLPRWQPRSRRGLFLGYSPHHSSDVPLVLNLQTGSISPQFHVVFDDSFSTVHSISSEEEPPDFWTAPNLEACTHRVQVDVRDATVSFLPDDWLTPHELEEKRRALTRQGRIRESFTPTVVPTVTPTVDPVASSPADTTTQVPQVSMSPESSESPVAVESLLDGVEPPVSASAPTLSSAMVEPSTPNTSVPPPALRRSARSNKGEFHSTKYIDEVYLSSILDTPRSFTEQQLAYHAELHTDLDSGEVNYFDAHAYVAKLKRHDPDNPTYTEAMSGDDAQHYIEAMQQEILALLQQRTWIRVDRASVPRNADGSARKILKGTWAFKLKRLPDGTPLKYKARYCCRGDMQTEGVDYFDTYAPVIQWSTIRLVLTLALKHRWSTRQVDYTNAFAQADIQEEVYIEPPRGFTGKDGLDKVLKLCKSLYGLKQAPKTFFDKLRAGLIERGFTPSNIDPCLFLKNNMICVVYVDDTILCGPDPQALEEEIIGLGVNNLEQRHSFQLRNEGEVGDFLGIRIQKRGDNSFYLTQTGLIDKVLAITEMQHCNSIGTPAGKEAIGSDHDGEPFSEKWKYSTVIGMLLYLSGNTRPDITFAVHQCARFSHMPKQSHAVAVKRIIRYLKGTKDKGMVFKPSDDFAVDCYVDADFAGLWGIEYDQDPVCVKSRTGYLINFMGCPLIWVSKLQSLIALSTMEAEYIALSTAMRELISIREVLKEIKKHVFESSEKPTYSMIAKTFEPLPASRVYEDNESCLKFATLPRMSPRTKHIAIPYHFFRSKVEELEIKVLPIDTKAQLADQFTKGLRDEDFESGRKGVMGW
jgi:hypothetical protein